jgi:glutathione S-transferase
MTTPFDQLREQAATKRDKAIQTASDEYRRTTREIQAIERKIGGPRKRLGKSGFLFYITECIKPGERFSIASIFTAIQAQFPERDAKRDNVKKWLLRLKASGLIQPVGRNDSRVPVYVVMEK